MKTCEQLRLQPSILPSLARVPGWSLQAYFEDWLHFMWQGVARDLGGSLARDIVELMEVPLEIQFEAGSSSGGVTVVNEAGDAAQGAQLDA